MLLPPTGSVELAQRSLADLKTGGRTPLAAGLAKAHELLLRDRQRERDKQALLVLLTDGRANAGTGGGDPLAEGFMRAALLRRAGIPSLVVDTEQGAVRLSLAHRLAEALGGVCLRLEELAAGTLAKAVRLSIAAGL